MISLRHPYPSVRYGASVSYGGNQMRSDDPVIRKCGCGPVAALDALRYLEHEGDSGTPASLETYNAELKRLTRRFFPLIPPFGINGLFFVAGMNGLFRERVLPYRAVWMLSGQRLWERVEEMLRRDLPVILSVAPNFPEFWKNKRLPLYIRTEDGAFRKAAETKGHYVTATGIDDDWVQISSWGRRYYINRREYMHYTRENSSFVFGNLLYLKEIKTGLSK